MYYDQAWSAWDGELVTHDVPDVGSNNQEIRIDFDDVDESRWVVTYIPGTGREEFSINDGRAFDEDADDPDANIVKIPTDEELWPDWNLGDTGDVNGTGSLLFTRHEDGEDVLYHLTYGNPGSIYEYTDPPGLDIFEGDNWNIGRDVLGQSVYSQELVGMEEANRVVNVGLEGVELNLLLDWSDDVFVGTRHTYFTHQYYLTNGYYTCFEADDLADNYAPGLADRDRGVWTLAILSNGGDQDTMSGAAENAAVLQILHDAGVVGTAWLGGHHIYNQGGGWSHGWFAEEWEMDWVNGQEISGVVSGHPGIDIGYNNFENGEPNDYGDGPHENYLEIYSIPGDPAYDGKWNDNVGNIDRRAVLERPAGWVDEDIYEEWHDKLYQMRMPRQDVADVRSDISYKLFTGAHDILDLRPRYETREILVPVIKYEQVTRTIQEPITQKRLVPVTSLAPESEGLGLDVFDLETVSANGTITINAGRHVNVQADVRATGETGTIGVHAATGDVTIGGEIPVNPSGIWTRTSPRP